eukprot:3933357-Rhodomonas_salina.2
MCRPTIHSPPIPSSFTGLPEPRSFGQLRASQAACLRNQIQATAISGHFRPRGRVAACISFGGGWGCYLLHLASSAFHAPPPVSDAADGVRWACLAGAEPPPDEVRLATECM